MTRMIVSVVIIVIIAKIEANLVDRGPLTLPGPTRIKKSPSEVALTWLDDQTMKIRLADNTTDKILLAPADNMPGLFVPCLFSGTFEGDPEAVVSVSGCKDEKTEVSIASKKIPGGLQDLFLSPAGKTSKITLHYPAKKISAKQRLRREAELEPSSVTLTWQKAKEIDVVFADGARDKIHLQTVTFLGEVTPCLFTGSLDNDQESEVTIVGCREESEVIVEILSKTEAGGILELIIANGKTYKAAADDTSWEGKADDAPVPEYNPEEDDGLAAQIGPRDGRLPQSVTLEISLRYDNSLLAEFGNNPTEVKYWLSRVVELAKPRMAAIDLGVHLKVVGTVEHFKKNIEATDEWIHHIARTENRGMRGPISYFSGARGRNGQPRGHGIAFVGAACGTSGTQININEKAKTNGATARLLSHELGHNIGMQHDFHKSHGGSGSPGSNTAGCEGEGLMSYGSKKETWMVSKRPDAWSTCSNSDFENWYRAGGHKCLKSGAGGSEKPGGSGGCKSEPGFFGIGDEIVVGKPGWQGWPDQGVIISAGAEDCANKCGQVSGCKAWTLDIRSNYCWLKKTGTDKVENRDFVRGKPCTSNPKRCECNGHKNEGGAGECNGVHPVGCGKWCYVDDDAQCVDTFPSKNSPFRWTCEACLGGIATRSMCTTTDGEACVFPFTWEGATHNECIRGGHPIPWCSTRTDGLGAHVTGNYGDCSSQCPGAIKGPVFGNLRADSMRADLMPVLIGLSVAVVMSTAAERRV